MVGQWSWLSAHTGTVGLYVDDKNSRLKCYNTKLTLWRALESIREHLRVGGEMMPGCCVSCWNCWDFCFIVLMKFIMDAYTTEAFPLKQRLVTADPVIHTLSHHVTRRVLLGC